MNIQENIQRIKEVMGINESEIPISIRRRFNKETLQNYINNAEYDLQFYCDDFNDEEDYAHEVIDNAIDSFLNEVEYDIEEKDYYSDVLNLLRNFCVKSFGRYLIDAYKTNCKGKKI